MAVRTLGQFRRKVDCRSLPPFGPMKSAVVTRLGEADQELDLGRSAAGGAQAEISAVLTLAPEFRMATITGYTAQWLFRNPPTLAARAFLCRETPHSHVLRLDTARGSTCTSDTSTTQ